MAEWSARELRLIGAAHGLQVSPFRPDGVTYGTPTWIWGVVVGPDIYVRAFSGTASTWYQAAVAQRAGRIRCQRLIQEVTFEPVAGPMNDRVNDEIDAAYSAKYSRSKYLPAMVSEQARAATVRVIPAHPVAQSAGGASTGQPGSGSEDLPSV